MSQHRYETTVGAHTREVVAAPLGSPDAVSLVPARIPSHLAPQSVADVGARGKIRTTGVCVLLAVVTLGIYTLVWYFRVHGEMKRHTRSGVGGGLALVLGLLVFVMPYVTANAVGNLYERRGLEKPVSGATGLWFFPGVLIVVGPVVWFIKTNGALNSYWQSLDAR